MNAKKLTIRSTVGFILAVAAVGCSAQTTDAPEAPESAGEALKSCTNPGKSSITRDEIIARAKTWLKENVQYGSGCHTDKLGSYRPDCSGFVSMTWGLRSSYSTGTLDEVSTRLPNRSALLPGDILLNRYHHVVLFAGWADSKHTKYHAYEETKPETDMKYRVIPYPYWSGYGTFVPYRYNHIAAPHVAKQGADHMEGMSEGEANGSSGADATGADVAGVDPIDDSVDVDPAGGFEPAGDSDAGSDDPSTDSDAAAN